LRSGRKTSGEVRRLNAGRWDVYSKSSSSIQSIPTLFWTVFLQLLLRFLLFFAVLIFFFVLAQHRRRQSHGDLDTVKAKSGILIDISTNINWSAFLPTKHTQVSGDFKPMREWVLATDTGIALSIITKSKSYNDFRPTIQIRFLETSTVSLQQHSSKENGHQYT